jgi:hypothetical protein
MSKYASLLFKPKEYHQIGPFRFPIYHDLVPGESKGIEEISRKQSKHTYRSIRLAQKIAKDRDITVKEAIDLLSNANPDSTQEILLNYAEDMEDLQSNSVGAYEQQIAFVTLFMQYRAEVRLPSGDKSKWTRTEDWVTDDTEHMPGKLLTEIFQFITWERDGWPELEGNDQGETPPTPPDTSTESSTTA